MKTPREILLERHRSANAKLDGIRTKALDAVPSLASHAVSGAQAKRPWPVRVAFLVWRELIWPSRRAWAGMAAAWLLLLGINRALTDRQETTGRAQSASASAGLQAIEEQRRVLEELIPSLGGRGIASVPFDDGESRANPGARPVENIQ
jgi:hypothetical protein